MDVWTDMVTLAMFLGHSTGRLCFCPNQDSWSLGLCGQAELQYHGLGELH